MGILKSIVTDAKQPELFFILQKVEQRGDVGKLLEACVRLSVRDGHRLARQDLEKLAKTDAVA